jgi:GT2 family glycosyltransferase
VSSPRLAAVVLSWNGREETLACLRSFAKVSYEPFEIVVVDNASADGSADAVAAEFPGVELVRSDRNLGYAGGMNLGAERALARGAEHVLLLNNDTVVDADAPGALVAEAERRPSAAALCPVVYFAEPPDLVWYAGARFDPRKGHQGKHLGYGSREAPAAVRETERACGAALLLPARAIAELGLFDEELFAYAEDADWSLRAREAGHELLVVPAARVWHHVSSATGGEGSSGALYYSVRNVLAVCERHAPLGRVGTWRRRAVVVGAHAAMTLRRPSLERLRAIRDGYRDFRRGRFGPRP